MTPVLADDAVDLTRDVPATPPRRLLPPPLSESAAGGERLLFGAIASPPWRMAGSGDFVGVDGRLESVPGTDLGLFWCTAPTSADFVLRLDWLRWRHEDASGVWVRFPEPAAPPDGNPALVAMQRGFDMQLDAVGIRGASAIHRTAAIVNQPVQHLYPRSARPPGEWNAVEIRVRGQLYHAAMNGTPVAIFHNSDPLRGRPGTAAVPSYIGLQVNPGARVAFRDIRICAL